MREFHSMLAFAEYLATEVVREVHDQHKALEKCAVLIEREAKAVIGEYQAEAGPFMAWAPLADSTLAEKQALGYFGQVSEDDPNLRTGETRDSIHHKTDHESARIGSDSENMVRLELGTEKMPPRSILGTAAVHKQQEVVEIIGQGVVMALTGKKVFGGAIDI